MSVPSQEFEGHSIVILGQFNPSIFQPLWFAANNLVRKQEAESATIEIVHKQATVFRVEWFSLQVTTDSFTVTTKEPAMSRPLRDLAVGTFKVLEHTPLRAFGMNRNGDYAMPSEAVWHSFGHQLAPKQYWKDILLEPGLLNMVIQGKRSNSSGTIKVTVSTSLRVPHGIFINVNEHHGLDRPELTPVDRNQLFLKTLQDGWDDFLSYAGGVPAHLFSETVNPRRKNRRQ